MSDWSCPKCNLRSGQTCADRDCPGLAKAVGQAFRTQRSSAGGGAMSDLDAKVHAAVARMRVDFADGYRLAAKVALAALEPTDGVFYARDQGEHLNLKRAHHRVKQKLDEAAEAWNIDMEEKS